MIKSKLNYTILRPCLIIGKKSHGFIKFVKYIVKLPVVPLTGSGNNRIQIVHIKDVIKGILNSINNSRSFGNIYYLCNKKPIKYKNYIKAILKALKLRKLIIPLPVFAVIFLGKLYQLIFKKSVITSDGILGLTLDYHFDISASQKDLNFKPIGNMKAIRKSI